MIKLRRFFLFAGLVGLPVATGGCDTATGTGGPAIVISANWRNAADSNHTIDFRSPDDGQSRGVVAGTEEGGPCPLQRCRVGGFWRDGQLEITIIREANVDQPKFTAPIYSGATEIVFQQVGGTQTFRLVR